MADNKTIEAARGELESRRHLLGDAVVDLALAALGAPVAASTPPPAVARLRRVSVLFADLADSTALLRRLNPEDVAELLDQTLQCFAAAVREAGGEMPRLTGDGALADTLLAAAVHEPPLALKELLVSRAEGNPFYMQELLRMPLDDRVIDTRSHPWEVHTERLQRLRVPETLVGVLQPRLDALLAHELAALQQASMVGPVFGTAALQQLDSHAPRALPARARRATIVRHASSAFGRDEEHAFHHQLLHEVTYGTVLKPRRLQGHAQAARWLSERKADRAGEFHAMTAEHFERAGDSAQALEYDNRAQSDAHRRFALEAALHLIERAQAQPAQLPQAEARGQLLSHPDWREAARRLATP